MSRDKSPGVYDRSPSPSQSSRSGSPESPPRRRQSSPSPSHRRGQRASSSRSISPSPPPRGRGGHHYKRRSYTRSRSRSRSPSPREKRGYRGRYKSRSPMSERKRHQGNRFNPNPSRVLGVFGLSLYTGEKELKEMFDRYGPIERVQVVYDHQTGRSRGFSFIYFADSDDALDAKEGCNGLEMDGRRIRVDFSITKRPHTPTPGVYMGRPTRSSPDNDSHSRGSSDHHSKGGDDHHGRGGDDRHGRGGDDRHGRGGDDRHGRGGDDRHGRGSSDYHGRGGDDRYSRGGNDYRGRGSRGDDRHGRGGGIACRVFVNISESPKQHPKAPLLLARYCDQLLRKSSKGLSEQEVDEKLDKAIIVFRYVEDKDMFQRFYTRTLSRRLVQHLSLSMEAEESMIQKLKHTCGYEYTSRLQRMLVDIKLSAEGNTSFTEHLQAEGNPLPISFSTLILQSAAWPLASSPCPLALTQDLLHYLKLFEGHYTRAHSGRKLSWLHQLSTGELKLTYLKRPYTVSVTTYQMVVLLAYNHRPLHTHQSLAHITQLGVGDLTPTLQSLIDARIITEQKDGVSSVLKLNQSYSNKRTKFKITSALQKESQQDVEQTQYNVQEDRKLHIQAAIVRVMKARKSLKHNQLVEEAITQLKVHFSPSVPLIKKCIETLMEKQYLQRDSEHIDTYNYVA